MLTTLHHYIDTLTLYLKTLFHLTTPTLPLSMPKFQIDLFVEQAIKQHKLVQIKLQLQENLTEEITGHLAAGPNQQTILMRHAKTTRIIFLDQVTYISAVTPTFKPNTHALTIKTCS